jgi:transcriptional regulator with GAF, ATPase, and Fis domain
MSGPAPSEFRAPARIAVAEGVWTGKAFAIAGDEFTIGRGSENDVAIAEDPAISRRHCTIRRLPGELAFEITDHDTVNGTYLNGVQISRAALQHGDRISVGGSTVVFFTREEEDYDAVRLEDSDQLYSTIELDASEVLRHAHKAPSARMEALLRFAGEIHATAGVRAIQHRVLEFAFETLPSKEGALLLSFDRSLEGASAVGWGRPGGSGPAPTLSRTVCARVLQGGIAVLSRDTVRDEDLRSVKSVERSRVRSLIAVPLLVGGGAIGMIYLQTPEPNGFDDGDLRFLTAISGIAGLAIENARRTERLEAENANLQRRAGIENNLIGESPSMTEVYRRLQRVAPAECTVLILGESGTGKELVARAIHRGSERANRPFIAVNCAVLSEALAESDLFGHEKGSFTGALNRREGKLELANGGTLFLDEIGELALPLQGKLLRVLQEREFERVGGARTIKVDVRILAATNRDLLAEATKGTFRLDLYYRLNVVSLTMPPLRARSGDIALLAEHFLAHSGVPRRKLRGLSPEARRCLMQYCWPGNVRELQNAIERAIVLGTTEFILPEDLPEEIGQAAPPGTGASQYHEGLARAKKELILRSMETAGGDYREAARVLGIHVTYLYRLIRTLDVKV